jgi:predicted nucleotidyltransferase
MQVKKIRQVAMNFSRSKISAFCRKNHIRKMSLFGSALTGKLRPDSDLDFLVEFDSGHIPGLIRLAGMEIELGRILGRKVDLRTSQDLSRYFREDVLRVAEVKYAGK